jgi:hypothetical protein
MLLVLIVYGASGQDEDRGGEFCPEYRKKPRLKNGEQALLQKWQ